MIMIKRMIITLVITNKMIIKTMIIATITKQ